MLTLDFPSIRRAPDHVVEGLRGIDPTSHLLWWGPRIVELDDGFGRAQSVIVPVWLLGTVQPNYVRRRIGAEMLRNQEILGPRGNRDTWRHAKLMYQHFAPVAFYPIWGAPHSGIVEDFKRRDWLFRYAFEAEGTRAIDEAEGLPQLALAQQTIRDKARGEGPDVWRFTFGGRRSFSTN